MHVTETRAYAASVWPSVVASLRRSANDISPRSVVSHGEIVHSQ